MKDLNKDDDRIFVEEDSDYHDRFIMLYEDFLQAAHNLSSSEFFVLIMLKKFANYRTDDAWPSVATLMKLTGLSKPTVLNALKGLNEKNVVIIKKRYDSEKKMYRSNLYHIISNPNNWKISRKETKKVPDSTTLVRQNQKNIVESDNNVVYLQEKDTTSINLCQSSVEKYDMDWLKNHYDYDALVDVMDESDAKMLMDYIYDILNSEQKTMTIEGTPLTSKGVIQRILELDIEDLEFVMDKFKSSTKKIRNTKAYLRTIMYNAKAQSNAEIKNTLHRDNVI